MAADGSERLAALRTAAMSDGAITLKLKGYEYRLVWVEKKVPLRGVFDANALGVQISECNAATT